MIADEILFWKRVAEDLAIDVVVPFEVQFSDGSQLKVSALIKDFGAKLGMLVSADFAVLRPYTDKIAQAGYGFSSNFGASPDEYERANMIEVLKDWGWSGGADRKKPSWL
ncbi:MAG: hypothetical protein WC670_10760 [Pseudolabrys sp.]